MTVTLSPMRVGRITGSRVPGVLGISPYATRDDVLREMTREWFNEPSEFIGSVATNHGVEHEPEALDLYEFTQQVDVLDRGDQQKFVRHGFIEWLGVTPDGTVGDGIVETKCPYRATYSHIDQRPDYQAQLQAQIACTGAAFADFVIWREGSIIPPQRVEPDDTWLERNYEVLEAFIEEFRRTIADPLLAAPHLLPLIEVRADPDWRLAAIKFLEAKLAIEFFQGIQTEAKGELITLADGQPKSRGAGVLLTRSNPKKGAVNWERIAREKAPEVDPEDYRKPAGEPGWTVRNSA